MKVTGDGPREAIKRLKVDHAVLTLYVMSEVRLVPCHVGRGDRGCALQERNQVFRGALGARAPPWVHSGRAVVSRYGDHELLQLVVLVEHIEGPGQCAGIHFYRLPQCNGFAAT